MKRNQYGTEETWNTGAHKNGDGTYTAITWSDSKTFKTLKGAEKWLGAHGYNSDGSKKKNV